MSEPKPQRFTSRSLSVDQVTCARGVGYLTCYEPSLEVPEDKSCSNSPCSCHTRWNDNWDPSSQNVCVSGFPDRGSVSTQTSDYSSTLSSPTFEPVVIQSCDNLLLKPDTSGLCSGDSDLSPGYSDDAQGESTSGWLSTDDSDAPTSQDVRIPKKSFLSLPDNATREMARFGVNDPPYEEDKDMDTFNSVPDPQMKHSMCGWPLASGQSVSCPSLCAMPSVVISDHSFLGSGGQEQEDDLPNEEYLISQPEAGFPSNFTFLRQFSTCSTCSSASSLSTLSLDEDSGLSDYNDLSPHISYKKPSAWRKVRNALHWSPFIQTYKKQKYPWVQLAGHQGNFKCGKHGTVLKRKCGNEEECFKLLMEDVLRPFVPEFKGVVQDSNGDLYLELEDLLAEFYCPCIMDVKMGVRTYLEEELAKAKEKPKLRKDMYEKMVHINPEEPTDEERALKAVTKPRYMVWRETISSTSTLGFRIEGIRNVDGNSSKDFKTTKTKEQVGAQFRIFVEGFPHAVKQYLHRLQQLKKTLEVSHFFKSHELIGSSLLFVHDKTQANIWLIDFAKTHTLPPGVSISHKDQWQESNHEDGYLIGVDNLVELFQEILDEQVVTADKNIPC